MMTCASRVPARLGLPDRTAPASPKCVSRRARLQSSAALLVAAFSLGVPQAHGQTWKLEPGVYLQETLTSNVNLSDVAVSDLVTEITPTLHITEKTPRTSLNGSIAVQGLLYARTGAENNQLYPLANLLGNAELVDRFFFVEAAVVASQQFFTPFGAQPVNIANATDNRYTSVTYRVSPYIQGTSGNVDYLQPERRADRDQRFIHIGVGGKGRESAYSAGVVRGFQPGRRQVQQPGTATDQSRSRGIEL